MITIFKTGQYDYSDAGIDKPVHYTIESLIEVASRTSSVNVTREHEDDVIECMSNFIVEDGLLKADEPKSLELSGMGFSPVFAFDLVDVGEYYVPKNITMKEVGYTKTPRSHIVYNSIEVSNGESRMEDKQLRDALDNNKRLNEEIGVYKSQIKQLNKAIKEKDKAIDDIRSQYSDVDSKLKEYDSLKEIESNYNSLISSKKDDLIYRIVGDDSKKAEILQDWSIEQLEFQAELLQSNKQVKGVTPQSKPVDDGDVPEDTHGVEEYTDEMFEEEFKASGL